MQTRPNTSFSLSVIIPTLNEALRIDHLLENIHAVRNARSDVAVEVILVDGGSTDNTVALARERVDLVLTSPAGRATQMNAGAAEAKHEVVLFLHSDTLLPVNSIALLQQAHAGGSFWGRFDVQFDSAAKRFRSLGWMMNWRSRLSGICTGDQGIFVRRDIFQQVGGYAPIALMEDIELSRRLRRLQPPVCLHCPVITASRRWQQSGYWTTVWLMLSLRWRYFFGASPLALAKIYYPKNEGDLRENRQSKAQCDVRHD